VREIDTLKKRIAALEVELQSVLKVVQQNEIE
jgi:hypothetical protein